MTCDVVLLPGDGIGPEVVDAAVRVLDVLTADGGLDLRYDLRLVGGAAIDAYGTPLRTEDVERCRRADAVVLGAVGGPAWDHLPIEVRPERGLLRLRTDLALGINLREIEWRPAGEEASPLKREVAEGTNISFVRELTGGVYLGQPSFQRGSSPNREAVDTVRYSESQIRTVLDFAFDLARSRRGKVTSVDKANVMQTSCLWRQVATEYALEHPEVQLEHALVDSFAMSLIAEPRRYDVVVTENLFGDILTDLAGVIAGSLGVAPSASLRPGAGRQRFGLYEPVHSSAPLIAGQGIANPTGCLLSVALMLEWSFSRPDLGARIRRAVDRAVGEGHVTPDLAANREDATSTDAFVSRVIQWLQDERGSRGHHVATQMASVSRSRSLVAADSIVYFDGAFMPLTQANVSVATHGLHYGTGCFEGIRAYWRDEHRELYILRLEEHVERFFQSCRILRITAPFRRSEMCDLVIEVLRRNGYQSDVYIRPIAFKSTATIKLTLDQLDDSIAIFAFPFGHYTHREGGLRVCLSPWRRIGDNAIPTKAKVTGSYVNAALASHDAHRDGYDEALLLNQNGSLAEASSSNIFLVRGDHLITPAVSENILEGITRDAILTLARQDLGLCIEERPVARSEVYGADEMFLSGTGVQIEPIGSVDGYCVGSGSPGPITTRLQTIYAAAVHHEIPAYASWCTPTYGPRRSCGLDERKNDVTTNNDRQIVGQSRRAPKS